MNQSRHYRDRAEAERRAALTALPNVRDIYLKSAFVWDRMADEAEAVAETRLRNDLCRLVPAQAVANRRTQRVRRIARGA